MKTYCVQMSRNGVLNRVWFTAPKLASAKEYADQLKHAMRADHYILICEVGPVKFSNVQQLKVLGRAS